MYVTANGTFAATSSGFLKDSAPGPGSGSNGQGGAVCVAANGTFTATSSAISGTQGILLRCLVLVVRYKYLVVGQA